MRETAVMRMYRFGYKMHKKKIPVLPGLIQRTIRIAFACELPMSATIGKGSELHHNGLGVVIHERAIIGENTHIYQNVTIGGRQGRGVPTIGNDVFIGCGACVLGGVVVGDHAVIGANATVIEDVPAHSVVVGPKARVVRTLES